MQSMKWSALALAVTAATSTLAFASAQDEAKGFVEDSSASVLMRNTYWNRDYNKGAADRKAWAQGFIGTFESGFTQGTVGVGVDAFGLWGIKLDGGAGTAGDYSMGGLLEPRKTANAKGLREPNDQWAQAGAAVKVRISNTVIKYGNQMPELPVLAIDDSRLLPESFTGTLITSKEIDGLELNAGRFTADSGMASSARDNTYDANLKSINVLGGSYQFNDDLSAALYYSDNEDVAKKKYANVNYTIPLASEQALNFDFNIYKSDYDKRFTDSGLSEDNLIWSLAGKYSTGPHAFILAFQRSSGDTGYAYDIGDGGSSMFLANSYYADFNNKNEKSWQASYELDFGAYGVPGLSWKTAYVYGYDIDTGPAADNGNNSQEREFFNQLTYVVQDGPAKNLKLKARNSIYRGSNAMADDRDGKGVDVNEWRLFVEYPLEIL